MYPFEPGDLQVFPLEAISRVSRSLCHLFHSIAHFDLKRPRASPGLPGEHSVRSTCYIIFLEDEAFPVRDPVEYFYHPFLFLFPLFRPTHLNSITKRSRVDCLCHAIAKTLCTVTHGVIRLPHFAFFVPIRYCSLCH